MVGREDLLGTVWLAGFVFTRCTGPCPELTLRMRSIQQGLADRGLSARLVTFTLDPEHDTPAVLAAYARRFHADPDRWWFLTGNDQPSTHRLIREGFLQTVVPAAAGEPLTHSTYFVLLDHQARIRAVYDGLDPQSKLRILGDVEALLQESPAS
jgi:protein SCO1/2